MTSLSLNKLYIDVWVLRLSISKIFFFNLKTPNVHTYCMAITGLGENEYFPFYINCLGNMKFVFCDKYEKGLKRNLKHEVSY